VINNEVELLLLVGELCFDFDILNLA
jgi:hypothetical protein